VVEVGRLLTAAVLAGLLTGCSGSADEPAARTSSPHPSSTAPTTVSASCRTAVRHAALPVWARAGFDPADQPAWYIIGEKRTIVGVVFGYPLVAGKRQDGKGNKILWVGKHVDAAAPADLEITARLNGTDLEVKRSVHGGPGPSLIDVPRPGCWTFDLSWAGGHDRIAVPYGA
jgi:hypothetical protein